MGLYLSNGGYRQSNTKKRMNNNTNFSSFIAITTAYWAFMLTDGALRMLVLLHFHTLGISALQLAYIFLIYEFMGVITNLSAGFLAKRFGLKSTLYAGLLLQIFSLLMLSLLQSTWSTVSMVIYATLVQALSGIAKDLTKTSAKSSVKILAPQNSNDILFKWVARLTGSKNAIKGVGFFVGCALIAFVGFSSGLIALGVILFVIFLTLIILMPPRLPEGIKSTKFKKVLSKDKKINSLSLARVFLFGARDVWFVVGIPLFFFEMLSDGSKDADRAVFFIIGSFMALWIIFYGFVQAWAPSLFKNMSDTVLIQRALYWIFMLTLLPLLLAAALWILEPFSNQILMITVIIGLLIFGGVFAINSSLHSFLILHFTSTERASLDVGFYYMSNASGRLIGTLLSGLSFQIGGFLLCILVSAFLLIFGLISTLLLRQTTTASKIGMHL